jgi:hypothetical protein
MAFVCITTVRLKGNDSKTTFLQLRGRSCSPGALNKGEKASQIYPAGPGLPPF